MTGPFDALLVGLEGELERKDVDTVGGLLQVILLESAEIRPMHYGFMNLDPQSPARAMKIEVERGRWVQHDQTAKLAVPLIEPARSSGST